MVMANFFNKKDLRLALLVIRINIQIKKPAPYIKGAGSIFFLKKIKLTIRI
jgi:hypothetical protein